MPTDDGLDDGKIKLEALKGIFNDPRASDFIKYKLEEDPNIVFFQGNGNRLRYENLPYELKSSLDKTLVEYFILKNASENIENSGELDKFIKDAIVYLEKFSPITKNETTLKKKSYLEDRFTKMITERQTSPYFKLDDLFEYVAYMGAVEKDDAGELEKAAIKANDFYEKCMEGLLKNPLFFIRVIRIKNPEDIEETDNTANFKKPTNFS